MHKYTKLQEIRAKCELKRRKKSWKNRKAINKKNRRKSILKYVEELKKPTINHDAPINFSFVHNPDEVLNYLSEAKAYLKAKNKVGFNISKIEILTPDAIALLIANLNDAEFHFKSGFIGNAPNNPELNKLFVQSGFYNFVKSRGFKPVAHGNLLHKESDFKVKPTIAQQATYVGVKHTLNSEIPFEPLYEILIECMSNTNNHASKNRADKCNWWLYVYNDPKTQKTSYSFFDLGVGIFESIIVKKYILNLVKGSFLYKNINIVEDLLSGKIQSRISEDNEIRGKGIPQIVSSSKLDAFDNFYMISNDVKINLKTEECFQLKHNLKGTFLYWELLPPKIESE